MKAAVLYAPGDVRCVEREDPKIIEPTDAIIRLSATCVCGSDLWPYRGIEPVTEPMPMGHEYVGIVEEVGSEVTSIKPGQFVVGSFVISDNTCPICRAGYQSRCVNYEFVSQTVGTQAEFARIPLADGTLVATSDVPSGDLIPDLLAASDVLGTGLVRRGRCRRGTGKDRRSRRRRCGRSVYGPGSQAAGRRAHYRDEPARETAAARPGVRGDRYCDGAWGRGCGQDYGPH